MIKIQKFQRITTWMTKKKYITSCAGPMSRPPQDGFGRPPKRPLPKPPSVMKASAKPEPGPGHIATKAMPTEKAKAKGPVPGPPAPAAKGASAGLRGHSCLGQRTH